MTFSSKRKSVSSKTTPLCQGLPYQGSWRRRRLRGWTKDAFRVSGITQVLLCTTSPTSSLRSMPPPLIRGGFAAVKFYRNTVCYCETKPLCQGLSCQGSCRADARLRGWTKDAFSVSEDDGEVLQRFRGVPETDEIPETPANSTGIVILIYPTRVCFARVSRHKFVTFCWWSAQTFGGIYWAISTRNG